MSAIRHGTAPVPVGEVCTGAVNEKLLGLEIKGVDGKEYRLVKATAIVAAPGTLCFKRSSAGGDSVTLTVAEANNCCGVAVSGQAALAVGDYFFLQVDGEMTLTGKSGHGISAGDYVMPSATPNDGKVEQASTPSALEDGLPLRAHTVATNVISVYPQRKLWGL